MSVESLPHKSLMTTVAKVIGVLLILNGIVAVVFGNHEALAVLHHHL